MRLAIDIPEQKYEWIKDNPLVYTSELDEAVRNGTPLDNIKSELISEYNSHTSEWSYCAGLQKAIELLDRKEQK